MVLDASFPNIQRYQEQIKGKMVQSKKKSGVFPYPSV